MTDHDKLLLGAKSLMYMARLWDAWHNAGDAFRALTEEQQQDIQHRGKAAVLVKRMLVTALFVYRRHTKALPEDTDPAIQIVEDKLDAIARSYDPEAHPTREEIRMLTEARQFDDELVPLLMAWCHQLETKVRAAIANKPLSSKSSDNS